MYAQSEEITRNALEIGVCTRSFIFNINGKFEMIWAAIKDLKIFEFGILCRNGCHVSMTWECARLCEDEKLKVITSLGEL